MVTRFTGIGRARRRALPPDAASGGCLVHQGVVPHTSPHHAAFTRVIRRRV